MSNYVEKLKKEGRLPAPVQDVEEEEKEADDDEESSQNMDDFEDAEEEKDAANPRNDGTGGT